MKNTVPSFVACYTSDTEKVRKIVREHDTRCDDIKSITKVLLGEKGMAYVQVFTVPSEIF